MPEFIDDNYDVADPIVAKRTYRTERRQQMISILKVVAAEADLALEDAGLTMPLFFSVPSSGGAVWAALQLCRELHGATIAAIVCDRGDRYISTGVYPD